MLKWKLKDGNEASAIIEKATHHIKQLGCLPLGTLQKFIDENYPVSIEDYEYGWVNTDALSVYTSDVRHSGGKIVYELHAKDPIDITAFAEHPKEPLSTTQPADMVNHPPHYQSESGIEVIDVIKAFTTELKGMEAICTANVIKYILRWKHKNGVEDLRKAQWYLTKLIEQVDDVKENK